MASLSLSREEKGRTMTVLAIFTLIVMFFVSNDSPLSKISNHVDSAIFFMSGKAWGSGLIPYVDFSDSKGPLLWLIEMLGYWISPTDYHGVWVLSVIVMTFTFYFCWLTAMEVLRRPLLSLGVAMTMSLVYFTGYSFLETRAETWCNLPAIYGIYLVVKLIMARGRGDGIVCISRGEAIGLGVAVMACLLIKWSIAAMMLSLCLSVLMLCWQSGLRLLKAIGWFFVGTAALALPFAIYLLANGAFGAFIQEYFIATSSAAGVGETTNLGAYYINEARRIYHSPASMIAILLALPGAFLLFWRDGWMRWLLPFCYCCFFALGSYRNHWLYYLQVSLSFSVLGLIWLAGKTNMVNYRRGVRTAIGYGLCIVIAAIYFNRVSVMTGKDSGYHNLEAMEMALADLYSSDSQPKLLCYRSMDIGAGICLRSIPATKYWTYQTGASEEMTLDQDDAVRERRADIIYTLSHQHNGFLEENGYRLIYQAADSTIGGRARLYMKKGEL